MMIFQNKYTHVITSFAYCMVNIVPLMDSIISLYKKPHLLICLGLLTRPNLK